jgi:hypothetical protein
MTALVVLNVPQFPRVNPLLPFHKRNPFLRMWQTLKRQIVDDVPEAIAICEFDCPRARCTQDGGGPCERLNRKGARELFWASPLGKIAPAYRVFTA